MEDKIKTKNKAKEGADQASGDGLSPDQIRAASRRLVDIIVEADKLIGIVKKELTQKAKEDLEDVIVFLQSVSNTINGVTYEQDFKEAKELIMSYFTDHIKDVDPYITTYASKIANDVLVHQYHHYNTQDRSIMYSALLSVLKEIKGHAIEVNITLNKPCKALGMYLHDGIKLVVQGNVGSYVAKSMQGGVLEIMGSTGNATAPYMRGGILKIHGTVEKFDKNTFMDTNKGEIWIADKNGVLRRIYSGNGKLDTDIIDEFFTATHIGAWVMIRVK